MLENRMLGHRLMGLRMTGLRTSSLATLAALVLAGCGSTVKLDETPVETRTPLATRTGDGLPGTVARTGAGNATTPQSQVATVNLGGAAGGVAGGVGGAAAAGATAAGLNGKLGRVLYFDFDSFAVRDEFRALIESHAKTLVATRGKRLLVEGHTDERGGREYNLALGQKRAETVAKSLTLLGASESQIEAVSFGKERPVAEGHDEAAWAQNRRAELKDR